MLNGIAIVNVFVCIHPHWILYVDHTNITRGQFTGKWNQKNPNQNKSNTNRFFFSKRKEDSKRILMEQRIKFRLHIFTDESSVWFCFYFSWNIDHSNLVLTLQLQNHITFTFYFSTIQYWLDKVLSTLFAKLLFHEKKYTKSLCSKNRQNDRFSFIFEQMSIRIWNIHSVHRFRSLTVFLPPILFISFDVIFLFFTFYRWKNRPNVEKA